MFSRLVSLERRSQSRPQCSWLKQTSPFRGKRLDGPRWATGINIYRSLAVSRKSRRMMKTDDARPVIYLEFSIRPGRACLGALLLWVFFFRQWISKVLLCIIAQKFRGIAPVRAPGCCYLSRKKESNEHSGGAQPPAVQHSGVCRAHLKRLKCARSGPLAQSGGARGRLFAPVFTRAPRSNSHLREASTGE